MLDETKFLRSQRNQLFNHITKCNLKPECFTSEIIDDEAQRVIEEVTIVYHEKGQPRFWFRFQRRKNPVQFIPIECSPWGDQFILEFSKDWMGWSSLLSQIESWLGFVSKETSEKDLWAEIANQKNWGPDSDSDNLLNSPLSAVKRDEVKLKLDELAADLKLHDDLEEEHFKAIMSQLELMRKQSEYLGAKDFKNAALGAILQMAMSATTSPGVTTAIHKFLSGLGSIFQGLPQLPIGMS